MNPIKKPRRFLRLSPPLALVASLAIAGPLAADEADPAYTMTVIVDAAHGSTVAAGKYERAIEKITARENTRDAYSRQTNLCVAYTKTGALEKATAACEAARALILEGGKLRGAASFEKHDRMYLALALSNLGVLHAAKGSTDIARRYFREAVALETGLSAPKINLARIAREATPNA